MSGVYIKGFQLPEKNDLYYIKVDCEPGKNPVATIWRKDALGPMSFGAFECIPVPDHGRLIDADAMENGLRLMAKYQEGDRQHGILGCCETIRLATTIIPAEEEETT